MFGPGPLFSVFIATECGTAQVLSVGTDSYGIPHVRFQVSFRRPNQSRFDGGGRMLALKSFADQYRERVSALEA